MLWIKQNVVKREWVPPQSHTAVTCLRPHMLFSLFRIKTCWATSSQHPCASSSLFSLPPPPPAAGPCPSSINNSLSSRARSGPHSQPTSVPRPPIWTPAPPRTAQGGCGWPPSRRTPAAALTWERRACWKISQPQEPARRLRNPPSRIWPNRTYQPRTDGALRGRNALILKRRSAERGKTKNKCVCTSVLLFVFVREHEQMCSIICFSFLLQPVLKRNISFSDLSALKVFIQSHEIRLSHWTNTTQEVSKPSNTKSK